MSKRAKRVMKMKREVKAIPFKNHTFKNRNLDQREKKLMEDSVTNPRKKWQNPQKLNTENNGKKML